MKRKRNHPIGAAQIVSLDRESFLIVRVDNKEGTRVLASFTAEGIDVQVTQKSYSQILKPKKGTKNEH